jgi:hypothetical protein
MMVNTAFLWASSHPVALGVEKPSWLYGDEARRFFFFYVVGIGKV